MGGSARSDDDRLPWLDAPRPRATPAARRARTPLLVLLGLFLASAIAMMAYLAGRGTAPVVTSAPTRAPAPIEVPVPAPVPPPPIAPLAPVVATPPVPAAAPPRGAAANPRFGRAKAKRKASVRRSSVAQAARAPARAIVVHRNTVPAPTVPRPVAVPQRRITWAARPFAGPRGHVIQLGAYRTQAQADAAWWRVARAYPYLATLPRVMTATGRSRGRPLYYRVRLATGSSAEARALCISLHRIGRGCRIV